MIIFLIGKHGTGKSTVGQALVEAGLVRQHISVGDLVRRCRKHQRGDLPFDLLLNLAMHKSGSMLSVSVARELLIYFAEKSIGSTLSVDGFPASTEHVELLPLDSLVVHITTPDQTRFDRLLTRARISVRKWSNDMPESARDIMVDQVVRLCQERGRLAQVENVGTVAQAVGSIARAFSQFGRNVQ